ncbi:hypothetical protein [Mycobacterium sp. URHB0044]|jgi:hypothetical protein|uniref:DUF6841 family protein n=1 Tax=Mycobacterium sp. URHB0044 TaxID=1380386 RepID=UPI00049215AA|nr:hypothetical protein [Mycobacterium sp. URHB0044]
MPVNAEGLTKWFDDYLDTFAACARGDREIASLLEFYGVPFIVTSDEGVVALTSEDQVAAVMQGQLDGLRANGYHHSDVLHAEVTVLNSVSGLYRGTFSRRDHHGAVIANVTVTYVATDGPDGLRISLLAAHGDF